MEKTIPTFQDKLKKLREDHEFLSASIMQTGPEGTTKVTVTVTEGNNIRSIRMMQNGVTQTDGPMVRDNATNTETEGMGRGSYPPGSGQEQEIETEEPRRYRPSKYFPDDESTLDADVGDTFDFHDGNLILTDVSTVTLEDFEKAEDAEDVGDDKPVLRSRPLIRRCSKCQLFKCGCHSPKYQ